MATIDSVERDMVPVSGRRAEDAGDGPGRGTDGAALVIDASIGRRVVRDRVRESEKTGLVEALLARERYGSVLEIGCGTGALASALDGRFECYVGMDVDDAARARCRTVSGRPMRFRPLVLPFRLPPGEHELVILSEVLQLLEPGEVHELAAGVAAHGACREIVVVGTRDEGAATRDVVLDAFVDALDDGFEHRELAVRRHYRIDALLR